MKNDNLASAVIPSSQHTSTSQLDKEKLVLPASSRQKLKQKDENKVEKIAPLGEVEAQVSDEPEYPSGPKL